MIFLIKYETQSLHAKYMCIIIHTISTILSIPGVVFIYPLSNLSTFWGGGGGSLEGVGLCAK